MSGVVLGFVALIWVATRPGQSTQARMLVPSTASSREGLPPEIFGPSTTETPDPNSGDRARGTLPASLAGEEQARAVARSSSELLIPLPARPEPTPTREPPQEPDATPREREETITTTRFHIVRARETLSAISQQYYGSPNRWRKIVEANRETLKDPNKITPGTKLIIPD